jgi:hypothetical protein
MMCWAVLAFYEEAPVLVLGKNFRMDLVPKQMEPRVRFLTPKKEIQVPVLVLVLESNSVLVPVNLV